MDVVKGVFPARVGQDVILVAEQVIKEVSIIGSVVNDRDLVHIESRTTVPKILFLVCTETYTLAGSGHLCATHALSNNRVAFTTHRSQTLRVQNDDLAPADLDQTSALEETRRYRDARAPRCKQPCDKVVCQVQHV